MQAYLLLIVAGFFVFNTLAGAAERKVYVTNAIDGDVLELLDNGKQYGSVAKFVFDEFGIL